MFNLLSKKNRNRLTKIEVNDENIDKEIAKLIIHSEKTIRDLQSSLKRDDVEQKNEDTKELFNIFEEIAEKTSVLMADVRKIRLEEQKRKNYITINDEKYLIDKLNQLEKLKSTINTLIEITKENPSDAEYQEHTLNEMIINLNKIIDAINNIKNDDDNLKEMYDQMNR